MNRKRLRKLQASFAKRGGAFYVSPQMPAAMMPALLENLLDCPDCRAAVLEACNGDDRKDVNIDEVMMNLAMSDGH